ncbi:hypothetical protein ACN2C3_00040 [Aliarcobacter butzleri]
MLLYLILHYLYLQVEVFPALSVIVALTVIVPPSAGASYDVLYPFVFIPAVISTVVVVPSGFLTFNLSPTFASVETVIVTSTFPSNSAFEISPSLFASSVITTVGAGVAVTSNTALSLPSVEVFPALSVIVALTVIVPPSAGASYDVLYPFVFISAVISTVVVVPSAFLTFNVSPTFASVGTAIVTSTFPSNSAFEISPSLFASSVITTVGAGVAVVSNTVLSLPSAEVFPALSVIVALTVIVPPSAGASYDASYIHLFLHQL